MLNAKVFRAPMRVAFVQAPHHRRKCPTNPSRFRIEAARQRIHHRDNDPAMKRHLVQVAACSLLLGHLLTGCGAPATDTQPGVPSPNPASPQFGEYWYQGKAEITSYALEQSRYGEVRSGHAVLIFVTEDLSESRHVKVDVPSEGDVNVLKLNFMKRFTTGIYPYSMMSSVFTPVHSATHPHTLKVTATVQEWCGHTFTQMNLVPDGYRVQLYSYFEAEGDQAVHLERALLEDEIWTRLRLAPQSLPLGPVRVIPGALDQRLTHTEWRAEDAVASRTSSPEGDAVYTLRYEHRDRMLSIRYNPSFPHQIAGWREQAGGELVVARASRKASTMIDYWNHNSKADTTIRITLGLE